MMVLLLIMVFLKKLSINILIFCLENLLHRIKKEKMKTSMLSLQVSKKKNNRICFLREAVLFFRLKLVDLRGGETIMKMNIAGETERPNY
ncbi:hypothetical protein N172_10475 [Pantoea dispersa EGD-AAK13]|nr:hypothetical protein N172_10475 [Pantoea dispersa EGD-AAK13]